MHINELFSLKGKSAIVTGASRGLGLMIAEGFAEAGANLVICSRKIDECEVSAAKLRELGAECDAVKCDISKQEDVTALVEHTIRRYGKIDILVNNAGISYEAAFEDTPLKVWDRLYNVNVRGNYFCTTEVGKHMIANKSGNIINIASMGGVRSVDPAIVSFPAYASTKGAIIMLTRHLSRGWAKYNIRVNGIAPGIFPTELTGSVIEPRRAFLDSAVPLGRLGDKDDFKGTAVFLASEASRYMTGSILWVDGGILA